MPRKKKVDVQDLAASMRRMNQKNIPSDIEGSYTGTGKKDKRPVQDADDL